MKTFRFSWTPKFPLNLPNAIPEYIIGVGSTFTTWRLEVAQPPQNLQLTVRLMSKTDDIQNLPGPVSCIFEIFDVTDGSKNLVFDCHSEEETFALNQCLTRLFPIDNTNIPNQKFGQQNRLWIHCTLEIPDVWFQKPHSLNSIQQPEVIPKVVTEMFNDAVSGLKSNSFADVTLISSDKKQFHCHSCYLAKQSPVMRSMIEGLKVSETGISIDDLDSATLTEVLRYIYTETIGENLKSLASKILYAVEKYMLPDTLKDHCRQALENTLQIDNAVEFLLIADNYGLKELKKLSVDTIVENLSTIRKNDKWISLLRDHPFLADDIFEAICENKMKSLVGFGVA